MGRWMDGLATIKAFCTVKAVANTWTCAHLVGTWNPMINHTIRRPHLNCPKVIQWPQGDNQGFPKAPPKEQNRKYQKGYEECRETYQNAFQMRFTCFAGEILKIYKMQEIVPDMCPAISLILFWYLQGEFTLLRHMHTTKHPQLQLRPPGLPIGPSVFPRGQSYSEWGIPAIPKGLFSITLCTYTARESNSWVRLVADWGFGRRPAEHIRCSSASFFWRWIRGGGWKRGLHLVGWLDCFVCMHACMNVRMYARMYVFMHMCMNRCMCISTFAKHLLTSKGGTARLHTKVFTPSLCRKYSNAYVGCATKCTSCAPH